ncbi:uncharacterized protein LOC122246605 [Penaeus japonicus]|uniref:uncharacterized protein LOC122246605 n=1 Tax=Penaeus japonicus TaxID=27405 RepID=UPI001C70FC21|nr:uncharacterized protein LOC122246605 [Penaeus japonicus]
MGFLMMKLGALLVLAVAAASAENLNPEVPSFVNTNQGKKFLELMAQHFTQSLNYLYTSKQYGSQYMERPGMAKFLMDASDFQWDEGIDFLKKYMQREGNIVDFRDNLVVSGKGELTFAEDENKFDKYSGSFATLISDAEDQFNEMNLIHSKTAGANRRVGDQEIRHYLDDKLETKAARIYELKTHKTNLDKLKDLGIAANVFDSAL